MLGREAITSAVRGSPHVQAHLPDGRPTAHAPQPHDLTVVGLQLGGDHPLFHEIHFGRRIALAHQVFPFANRPLLEILHQVLDCLHSGESAFELAADAIDEGRQVGAALPGQDLVFAPLNAVVERGQDDEGVIGSVDQPAALQLPLDGGVRPASRPSRRRSPAPFV